MKHHLLLGALLALGGSIAAGAQSSFMPDVIGQAVANSMGGGGNPKSCYDGRMQAKPAQVELGAQQVDAAIADYLKLAAGSTDASAIFVSNKKMRRLTVDGVEQDARAMRDPIASRVARVERTGFVISNRGLEFHGTWRAIAADGQTLGTYDAWMVSWGKQGARIFSLDVVPAGSAVAVKVPTAFCYRPGDIEEWSEANAKREADKAERRARRSAARQAQ